MSSAGDSERLVLVMIDAEPSKAKESKGRIRFGPSLPLSDWHL